MRQTFLILTSTALVNLSGIAQNVAGFATDKRPQRAKAQMTETSFRFSLLSSANIRNHPAESWLADSSLVPNGNGVLKTAAADPKLIVDGKIKATEGALDDAAIEVIGAIKVSGSNKAAFQVYMTIPGSNYFQVNTGGYVVDYYRITTPMTANDPAAIIVATPVSSILSYPFWIGYDAANSIGGGNGQWYIAEPRYNGQGGFPNGTRFNVMIMKQ